MRRLLLPLVALAAVAGLTAPAHATLGSCVSLNEECWTHQCSPSAQTVDKRLWWHDTGPIIHICL